MAVGDMDTCPYHEKNKVVLFCQSCEELICARCVSHSPDTAARRHFDHVYLDLVEAYDIQREDIEKLVAKLRESLDIKRQQKQVVQSRIQKLKLELLRKKESVEKQCRSLHDQVNTEKRNFTQNLDGVISSSVEQNENTHKTLDYDIVCHEGMIGTINSLQKLTPLQCTRFLRGITNVKRDIKAVLEADCDPEVDEGDWVSKLNALREINLNFQGEKKALSRAFLFAHRAPTEAPRIVQSWSVVGSRSASIVWKHNKQEKSKRFLVHCRTRTDRHRDPTLVGRAAEQTIFVKSGLVKRYHVVIRDLEPATPYTVSIVAVNDVGQGPAVHTNLITHSAHAGSMTPGSLWSEDRRRTHFRWPSKSAVISATVRLTAASIYTAMLLMLVMAVYEKEWCEMAVDKFGSAEFFELCPFPDEVKNLFQSKTGEGESGGATWWDWLFVRDNQNT